MNKLTTIASPKVCSCECRELGQILDTITTAFRIIDLDSNIIKANHAFSELSDISSSHLLKMKCYETLKEKDCNTSQCMHHRIVVKGEKRVEQIIEKTKQDGTTVVCQVTGVPYRDENGQVVGIIQEFVDLTTIKQLEQKIEFAKQDVETERKALESKNQALKEILEQIEYEKEQFAKQAQQNVEKIVLPLVQSLKDRADPLDAKRISLIEGQLIDITDPFISNIKKQFSKLTPRETQICNMIKQSLSSKEIAHLLHTSEGTVEQQRKKIRRKLGLRKSGTNLTSFLQSS